jgi:Ser/Thr protein kinase RdoA (MazF antagonist)
LEEELKKRYGFKEIKEISEISNASANIFKIKCDSRNYILKEYQSAYNLSNILKEEKITCLLRENGIPTAELVFCMNGEYAWEYNGRIFVLQKFVEGIVIGSHEGSHKAMMESAYYLSKINLALQGIQLEKEDNIADWLASESILKAEQKYEKIIEECNKRGEDAKFKRIKEDILTKKKLLKEFMENKKVINSLAKITHINSHGDYSVLQFIYEPDKSKIKAILDLSVAAKLPVVWEVIRSYSYIDPKCKGGEIDIKNLKDYVKEYMKNIKLTEIDLSMMPYVYLIQLLKSPYGYLQYVLNNSENKEQLIEFAFWRTKMCKWLASNAERLSKELEALK